MKHLILLTLLLTHLFSTANTNPQNTVILSPESIENLGIKTSPVEESSFEEQHTTLGVIQPKPECRFILSSRAPGRIIEILAHAGDTLEANQLIAKIESRHAGNPPAIIELRSPAKGSIYSSQLNYGTPVETDMQLMEIIDLSQAWVSTPIPQSLILKIHPNTSAKVTTPTHATALDASFLKFNSHADPSQNTIDAIFLIKNPTLDLKPGIRTEVTITTSKRDGVFSIPRSALQGDAANRFVFMKDYELKHTFIKTPVTIGDINSTHVEIRSGLFPGDEVVTHGGYSLSFAGKGNISLKEAMDAAHGHNHTEDGSEIKTDTQHIESSNDHSHSDHQIPLWIIITLSALTPVLILAIAFYIRKKSI